MSRLAPAQGTRPAARGPRLAVCAPNAFKGSLSAVDAAAALARGARDRGWDAIELPVADGGDGTLDVLLATTPTARVEHAAVSGPLGRRRRARLGWISPRVAVVELAEVCGLRLLAPGHLVPLRAGTGGAGELIRRALDGGAERIIVGVGGSASTDGGAGLLTALGARFLDSAGDLLRPGGGSLERLASVDLAGLDRRLRQCRVEVAVDVFNPLLGPDGAAAVYAPQKGADAAQVDQLERGLRRFAELVERAAGTPGLAGRPGAGAAGGSGFGLAVLGADIVGGAALVCDQVGLDAALLGAGLVITGEGRLDGQTASGKAPAEVLHRARDAGVPCVAVSGVLGEGGRDLFAEPIVLADLGEAPLRHTRSLLRRAGALAVARVAPLRAQT